MTGQTISHYRILEKLGEGGMGVVYKAEDTRLRRTVALKFLPPHARESRERFMREAQAAAALNHPNICTIYEVDEAHCFLAMELLEGKSVREKISERPLKLDESLDIAIQICDGLQAAHERGVIHRDIKPANVMVTPQGLVKIMDFGLAQIGERSRITQAGVLMGTPAYMSPEQARGEPTDRRTDLWSVGVLLYEMVSGRLPFAGESDAAITSGILHLEPEPLTAVRTGVPRELDRIIAKALRKNASERYAHAEDLRIDFARAKGIPAERPQRPTWIYAGIGALVLILLAVGFLVWRASRVQPVAEPLRAVALTTFPGLEYYPSFSPEGNHLVFTWTGPKQDNQDLYVQMIGSGLPLRLTTDPRHDYSPVWSPDGRSIAFLSGPPPAPTGMRSREVRIIPPLGGAERKLRNIRGQDFDLPGALLSWTPDSRSLVVTDSLGEGKPDALFVLSVETGEEKQLTKPQSPVIADTSPAVSPDGRWLAFLRRTSWGYGELQLLPLGDGFTAAGEPKRLTDAKMRADYPAWTPDSKEIVFSAKGSLWRMPISGENTPTRIAYVGDDGLMPAISRSQPGRNSRLAYVRRFADANFWRIETSAPGVPTSSAPVQAIGSTKPEFHIRFSPNGRKVAFSSGRSGDREIWVSDPDGANAVQLTSMGAQETMCPYWSPDGETVAFASNPDGEFDIYSVPVAGGKPTRLTSHPGIDICPAFSRDGNWIYFSSMRSGDYRIWKMPSAGGDAVQVTTTQGGGAAIESKDGSLYYNTVGVISSVWRLSAAGSEPKKVLDGVYWFNYHVLGKGIYYIDRVGSESRLRYHDLATGKSTLVAGNLGEVSAGLAVSSDGKTILFTRMDSSADDLMLVDNFR